MSICNTSHPERVVLHFVAGWGDKGIQEFNDVYAVYWLEHVINIRLQNHNSVTYPYRELRMIEEFDDDPSVCK